MCFSAQVLGLAPQALPHTVTPQLSLTRLERALAGFRNRRVQLFSAGEESLRRGVGDRSLRDQSRLCLHVKRDRTFSLKLQKTGRESQTVRELIDSWRWELIV